MRVAGLVSIGLHAALLVGLAGIPLMTPEPLRTAPRDFRWLGSVTRAELVGAVGPLPPAARRAPLTRPAVRPPAEENRRAVQARVARPSPPRPRPPRPPEPRPAPPAVTAQAAAVPAVATPPPPPVPTPEVAAAAIRPPAPVGAAPPSLPQLQAVSAPTEGGGQAAGAAIGTAQGVVPDAQPIYQPEPEYPRLALSAGREGYVEVEFAIRRDGTTRDVRIVRADPPGVFDRAALRAVEQWKYAPPQIGGVAVERPNMRVVIEFEINLRRPPITRN
jgi:periplasmic protein TonB